MGAKQSKRSVDISGKEAEGAGEVAAAGAGGEGRVEQLADADALKPAAQLNGDAHIHQLTDKEKQLDSGTPENEKDATTEKDGEQEETEEREVIVTNGEGAEQKTENGDSAPTPEETKKPKKEKVKKKWSLRSISFSRKDKPKQEKKQKEEEPKANGEPEKVPEEAAEVTTETVANEDSEVKSETETKEKNTPETPVTEPITNGSNTPESPKEDVAPVKDTVEVASEPEKTGTKVDPEPEQLPINGLSIEEPLKEIPEVAPPEESKSEVSPAEPTETVPAAEIPVQKEVCVDQMPLIESTPPPLPANPPPSSVATFAATTMAPDLTDASLANTAESTLPTPPILDTKADLPKECHSDLSHTVLTYNETDNHVPSSIIISQDVEDEAPIDNLAVNVEAPVEQAIETTLQVEKDEIKKEESQVQEIDMQVKRAINGSDSEDLETPISPESPTLPETLESDASDAAGDLPPPPPPEDDEDSLNDDIAIEKIEPPTLEEMRHADPITINTDRSNGDHAETNGIETEQINGNVETQTEVPKTKTEEALENASGECNGNAHPAGELPGAPQPQMAQEVDRRLTDAKLVLRLHLQEMIDLREPVAVSDKIAELIPEVPVVPELNTETGAGAAEAEAD